jgi:hypothetical protein
LALIAWVSPLLPCSFLEKGPSGKVDVGYVTPLGDDAAAYTGEWALWR